MRFKFEGRWEAESLVREIEQALLSFCKHYGIKNLAGVNLYFNMYNENGEEIEIETTDGQPLVGMSYKNPSQPKRVKKRKSEADVIPFQPKDSKPDEIH